MVPYVPMWAFTLPWNESFVPTGAGDPVWLRKVGQEPTGGFLGLGKKGAAEYVGTLHTVLYCCWACCLRMPCMTTSTCV